MTKEPIHQDLEPPRRILALDVSSTCAGYACFVSGVLDDFGKYCHTSKNSIARIDAIMEGICNGIGAFVPDVVIMEWSDGKGDGARAARRARERGKESQPMAGLVVLGQAQGAVRWALKNGLLVRVETVNEKVWTAGRTPAKRTYAIAVEYPAYKALWDLGQDRGHDIADAIGIGLWYLAKSRIEALLEGSGNPVTSPVRSRTGRARGRSR